MRRPLALAALTAALVVAWAVPAGAATGTISTVAGTGTAGFNGDNIPATTSQLTTPVQAIPAPGGGFVIADQVNFRVRKVAPDGTITPLAGTGVQSSTGDGGPATSATLAAPSGLAFLPDGSLLIAEANGNRIRKIATNGTISTVVGTGGAAFSGDNGPATTAQIRFPYDVAVYSDSSYVIADTDNNRIRFVSAAGTITTFGSTGAGGALNKPSGVALMADGSVLIADAFNHRIRRAYANGTITTVAGTGTAGYTGDGGPAVNARLSQPSRVAVQSDGGYLVADRNNNVVRRVDADGTITTIAGDGVPNQFGGDGGPALNAQLNQPVGVSVMPNGDFLVTDTFNQRIRLIDNTEEVVPPPPPPPPPVIPPPPVERNVRPPTMAQNGASFSFDNPVYRCTDGTWEGLAADPQFKYVWYKVVPVKGPTPFSPTLEARTQVSTSVTYRLPDKDRGAKFRCVVQATTGTGQLITAASCTCALTGVPKFDIALFPPQPYGDIRVSGVDVFQATQPSAGSQRFVPGNPAFPALCSGGTPTSFHPRLGTCGTPIIDPGGAQRTNYVGVPLDGGQPATAVVYVTMTYAKTAYPNQDVNVALRGRLNGKLITNGGTPTAIVKNPPPQQDSTGVTAAERDTTGVQIQIPNAWLQAAGNTDDRFDLEASAVLAPSATLAECEVSFATTTNCSDNDTYRVDNVGVWSDLAHIYISPLAMLDRGQTRSMFQAPEDRTRRLREVVPGGRQITIGPWRGEVDISGAAELTAKAEICEDAKLPVRDCRQQAIEVRVQDYLARERNGGAYDFIMGMHRYPTGTGTTTEPGWQPSRAQLNAPFARFEINEGSDTRALTVATHEFIHAFGILHADTVASDPLTGETCGGGVGGFGEAWPPENTGRLQAAAFGRYDKSGNRTTDVDIDTGTKEGALFDLMSYCSTESTAWISPYNWTRVFNSLRGYKSKVGSRSTARDAGPRARATVAGQGYVIGTVTPNGISIERIVPADPGNEVPAAEPGSPVQITALGASGQPVGTVGASVNAILDADTPVSTFIAPLPAGAAAVTAASGANTDRVERSKPPTLKLLTPRSGTRVGGSSKSVLGVSWTAEDPDGGTLDATVEYAPDGKSFKPVFTGPSRGRASVRGDLLSASRKGRIRVTVSDGFNQARAISGSIVADGRAPKATILAPQTRDKLSADGQSVLSGQALDDTGRELSGKSLTWFAGSKRLGTGKVLRAALPAGSVRLRLVARDTRGRTTTTGRTVRVAAIPLTIGRVDAPPRVKPKVKTVSLTTQTSTAATLRIGGKSYAVGPKAKKLTIALPAKPAIGPLKLAYTVTARGAKQKVLRGTVVVVRV
jgi:hypothetical protein